MRLWAAFGLIVAALLAPMAARADVTMTGSFLASTACPAEQSFNKHTNPGNVTLVPQQSYRLVSANKMPASHYLLIVPGADPERRWVAIDCGTVDASGAPAPTSSTASPTPAATAAPASTASRAGARPTHFVLALSWEPGFCAGHGDKPECAAETHAGFDASHFTLHGLWPDPNEYCEAAATDVAADKASHWGDLPVVSLTPATRSALDAAMPGTKSLLERHEWLKHGTCAGVDPDAYFGREIAFLGAVNAGPVQKLFAGNVGQQLTLDAIRAAFDQAFGTGAGQRIRLSCTRDGSDRRITELTLGLDGDVMGTADLRTLIAAARPTNGGCDKGIVTAVQ